MIKHGHSLLGLGCHGPLQMRDGLKPQGRVELFVTKGRPKLTNFDPVPTRPGFPKIYRDHNLDFKNCVELENQDIKNIILNQGKDIVIQSLTTGFINVLARMAIGDRGTIPSDPTIPKVPTATMTALYNEVYRDDCDSTVLNVGTPTVHEAKFIKIFSSTIIPVTSFSNQANPVVNEVALISADLLGGNPLPRAPVAAPGTPDADEKLFSIRTFKSVPFAAANEISITIRYTIFIE